MVPTYWQGGHDERPPSNPTLAQALIILAGELVMLALAIIRLPFRIIRALLGR